MKKKVRSLRLDAALDEEFERMAKALGVAPSVLLREFVSQGISGKSAIADFMNSEAEKTEKRLRRIEDMVAGHLHLATVVATKDPKAFVAAMVRGRKNMDFLDGKKSDSNEQGE